MKKSKFNRIQFIIILAVLFLFFGCKEENTNSIKTVKTKQDETALVEKPAIVKDTLLFNGVINIYQTFKNPLTKKMIIKDKNHNIKLSDIYFFSNIGNGFQVLNQDMEVEYYDLNLNKVTNLPKNEIYGVCGNVNTYGLKIEEDEKFFKIKMGEDFSTYNFNNYQTIDSIKKERVRDIYFSNRKKELFYDGNFRKKELVIIEYDDNFGIRDKKETYYYDAIDLNSFPIKVKRNNLFGYYKVTENIRYKELEAYNYDLAKFIDKNGMKGFVDRLGNEYLISKEN